MSVGIGDILLPIADGGPRNAVEGPRESAEDAAPPSFRPASPDGPLPPPAYSPIKDGGDDRARAPEENEAKNGIKGSFSAPNLCYSAL
jgi:hypothetical protein